MTGNGPDRHAAELNPVQSYHKYRIKLLSICDRNVNNEPNPVDPKNYAVFKN